MRQLHIVCTDHPGVLADIAEAMAGAGVNIETCQAERIGGSAVVLLTVDRYDDALRALAGTPYVAFSEEILLVRLPDRPGALAGVARRFRDAGINLSSVRIVRRGSDESVVAICAERSEEARALVRDLLIG